MAFLKTEAPIFDGREQTAERVARLANYLTQHAKELDFVLTHLNGENMNGTLLTIGVSDGAGNSVGTVGLAGSGVGIVSGSYGIRVTASGVEIMDGGDWADIRSLVTLDETPTEGSENGVTSGGVYDAIGKMKPVTLWENTGTSGVFSAQTVTISELRDYDMIYVEIAGSNARRAGVWGVNEYQTVLVPAVMDTSGGSIYARECTLQTSGIYFSSGTRNYAGAVTMSDTYAVPVRVLCVKY